MSATKKIHFHVGGDLLTKSDHAVRHPQIVVGAVRLPGLTMYFKALVQARRLRHDGLPRAEAWVRRWGERGFRRRSLISGMTQTYTPPFRLFNTGKGKCWLPYILRRIPGEGV